MSSIAKNPAGSRRRDAVEAETGQHEVVIDLGKTITFYGASDDLIEVEGDIPGCDEYPADGSDRAKFEVAGLCVSVFYTKGGVWGVSVSQIDEDVPVLARVTGLRAEGYTMKLSLAVPMGAHVTKVA